MSETVKVKGVQFNYVQFLWKEIAWIKDMEKQGQYQEALQSLLDLLHTLPENIYKKFRKRVETIHRSVAFLRIKVRRDAIDWFNRIVLEKKVLQRYARIELNSLLREVCTELDRRGYMEQTAPIIPEGVSHTMRRRQ